MDQTTILGSGMILGCAALLAIIYVWSVRRIDTIHRKKLHGLRRIREEFGNGRAADK
jgi:hypothetical protein